MAKNTFVAEVTFKVFDTVNHYILLKKIVIYGISCTHFQSFQNWNI